ncbi:MAG: N-carbamoylputrescine amidase [Syntrophomonadaceae bacterium]|nr:N-carbamoylputrescine amidase [Syntrophomonadaceae bacterium]
MRKVKVAAVQMSCRSRVEENIGRAESLVRTAANRGANIIVLPELFANLYFCQKEKADNFGYAAEIRHNQLLHHFSQVARELQVVLPISFYEKKNQARYNSVAVIDANGELLGVYRKSHIPDGPGYEEKFYFNPGDTGFRVWNTRYGRIGVGICWDQWFPEAARCMALLGAEMLLYPTAIGSEPQDDTIDSRDHWQIVMQGHAAANFMPVVAANRVGTEKDQDSQITFYGSSFIAGSQGNKVAEAGRQEETVILADFDLDQLEQERLAWGIFRDRRPDLYRLLCSSDGERIVE